MKEYIIAVLICILIALGLSVVEAWVITKLLCFIFTLTYSTTFVLKVWAGLFIINAVGSLIGRRK